ncbi:MAG: chromate transporter [Bacillota bacterium]|jgi:chromate transporter
MSDSKMTARPSLLKLFSIFFRVGAFTFGGGLAMIPLIQRELVDNQGWLEEDDFIDMIGLTQSAPGPIAVNAGIYLGYRLNGVPGAIASLLGTVMPSLLIIMFIAWALSRVNLDWLNRAFAGIRPTVVALIASAAYSMGRKILRDQRGWIIALLAVAGIIVFDLHAAVLIVAGAVVGLVLREKPQAERGEQ